MKSVIHSTEENSNNTGSPQTGEPVFLVIGKLQRTHGVQGEILMEVLTDFPERILKGNVVYVGATKKKVSIFSIRSSNRRKIIHFDGLANCEEASVLRNQFVYINTSDANHLPEGEFYHHEVIGMTVVDESGKNVGIIQEILVTGANDVYLIIPPTGGEILIPAIKSVVLSTDPNIRRMVVRLPEWE
ncbi:MAG: ribosome maturation factor RimM [Chloroflexi bacterium]|nr:ribosome maturation factor RimM [Chloroflexota bacterium]